jgi:CheY-like chemotaxis protein
LLSNAYKFTEKGEIHFEAKFRSASLQKVIIDFKISDTGIGIAGDKLDNIFQSFEQAESSTSRKYGGTGLGLSITRKLLDLMKGEIRVTSVLGKGSTFYMSIPFNKYSETGPISEEAEDKTGSFSPVLIIDKSSNSSEAIRAVFDSLPVAYKILINPVVDVDELANSLTNEKLIIIDSEIITTEEKLLTDELPRALNSTKNIPVIVMAPSTVNLNKDDLIARGLYSILRKPLFPRDVKATLNEPLELRQDNALLNQQDIIGIGGGRSLHLLLAEDNPINTKLAVGLIQLKNWKVDCAVNGMEAVEMFKLKSYDLVLMDIQMPEMDGMDATRKIREIEAMKGSKHTPIVALSAHAMKNDIDKALSCGMDDYITKPFKPKELYIIIDKLTQRNIEN